MKQQTPETDETSTDLDIDEIELALRRFASANNNQPLTKLLNSMFTGTAEDLIKHENSPSDPSEDKKEKE